MALQCTLKSSTHCFVLMGLFYKLPSPPPKIYMVKWHLKCIYLFILIGMLLLLVCSRTLELYEILDVQNTCHIEYYQQRANGK